MINAISSVGQTRTITGTVIDYYDIGTIPGVKIQSQDSVLLGVTDSKGNFKIELPAGKDKILLSFLGMEWTVAVIPINCNNAELIMMGSGTYDFMTIRKVNKIRNRIFQKYPEAHRQAFEKGIFKSSSTCVNYVFRQFKKR